jgi:SAM-dependent methyltransferase
MSEWTAGYVSDIEYLPGFYREQAPAHLDLACLIGGVQPPERLGGLAYCELGCGQAMTALLLAAANPGGHFVGIDFNPAHIARGRVLAAEAGITNLQLIEASFAEMNEPGAPALPQFDYITLHGVFTWISPENRREIVRFLARHVKPGGVVYVSYNAMPGWTMALPLQRLLLDHASTEKARSDRAVERAIAFAKSMQQAGARAFADPAIFEKLEKEIERGQIAYLAHEYLNENWLPLYHADVAREMQEAKLSFVASASLLENYPDLTLSADQRAMLEAVSDPVQRETYKDFFLARSFRRDVFVRGPRRLSNERREISMGRIPLALIRPPEHVKHDIAVPLGEARLEEKVYAPVFGALARGVMTPAELLDLESVRGKSSVTAVELVGMLVGSSQALAAPSAPSPGGARSAEAFNRSVLQKCFGEGRTSTALASPVAASGIHVNLFEMLCYDALRSGAPESAEAIANAAWSALSGRGESLRKDGVPIVGAEENLAILRQELATVLRDSIPIWRRLGVV